MLFQNDEDQHMVSLLLPLKRHFNIIMNAFNAYGNSTTLISALSMFP